MPVVTVDHGGGNTETIPKTIKWERTAEVGKMRRAVITVERSDAETVTLNEKEDYIELGNVDTLRLIDVETGGSTWRLVCYSDEWLANRQTPTDGGTLRQGSDADLVNTAIGNVPGWSAGTVTEQAAGLSFVFNHAYEHETLRRVEKNVPGEIQFRDKGTVDYVPRLGSDKSGSIELSSTAGTIEDEISITKRGRELDGTHIRVLGAHEGEAQIYANLVPAGDSGNYDNEVTYTTSRWSDSSDTDWDRWENKDVTDQATIEEEAAQLGEELKESLVEAKATVPASVDIEVGDTVQVVKADADLNRSMRIHRLKTISEGAKRIYKCLLSTRTTLRDDGSEDLRDIQRFNSGFQGSSVVIQGGGSRQPVDIQNNAQIPFFYPNIEYENSAELYVRGLPYRGYSAGAGVTSGEFIDFDSRAYFNDSQNDQLVPAGDSYDADQTLSFPSDFNQFFAIIVVDLGTTDDSNNFESQTIDLSVRASTAGDLYNERLTTEFLGQFTLWIPVSGVNEDDTVEFEIGNPQDVDIGIRGYSSIELWIPEHSHAVKPGIENFATNTPSNVDVLVDGTTVASNIGTGEFETVVDVSGELTNDAWNLIELTSFDLGHLQAGVSIDAYKQIGTQ